MHRKGERFMPTLFDAYTFGDRMTVTNRIVMAPMTRTRTSDGDVPNEMMVTYYGQRATSGLIVTEAAYIAPSGKGYVLTPGIYTEAQRQGWRLVTDEVHRNGGKIFLQALHVGRMSHPSLMTNGDVPWGGPNKEPNIPTYSPMDRMAGSAICEQVLRDASVRMKSRLWSEPTSKPSSTRGRPAVMV
jgi:2,4-dienoyl-CoA reductase-like NADH-dependent reductase (Old Yellow Enzyme family)